MQYCLMRTGKPITPEVAEMLCQFGKFMYKKRKTKMKFNDVLCNGVIETADKHVALGAIAGVEFAAQIEFEGGLTRITFVIPTRDLPGEDDAAWFNNNHDGTVTPMEYDWN